MRTLSFWSILLFALSGLFMACEQDSTTGELAQPVTASTNQAINNDSTITIADHKITKIDSVIERSDSELESRSNLIYQTTASVQQGHWFLVYLSKSSMKPNCAYEAKLTSNTGNADLYLFGRSSFGGAYNLIKSSTNPSFRIDQASATLSDLQNNESRLYFAVYGESAASFRLEIFEDCGGGGGQCLDQADNCNLITYEVSQSPSGGSIIGANNLSNYQDNDWRLESGIPILPFGGSPYDAIFQIDNPGTYKLCVNLVCDNDPFPTDFQCCQDVVISGGGGGSPTGCNPQQLSVENFEQYNDFSRIAFQSSSWDTWDAGREGGVQDGYVSNFGGINNSRALWIRDDKIQDVVYKLGNLTQGKYELKWKMRMTGSGYFNIQANQFSRVGGGAVAAYFTRDGRTYIKTHNNRFSSINFYSLNQWIDIKITADFNTGNHIVEINGQQYPLQGNLAVTNLKSLGGINFWAPDGADFYVDDIRLSRCL